MGQQGGGREPGRLGTGLRDEPSGWWLGWLPPRCPTGRGSLGDAEELFLGVLQCGCERGTGEPGERRLQGEPGEGAGARWENRWRERGGRIESCVHRVCPLGFAFSCCRLCYFLTTFLILRFLSWCSSPPFSD